MFGAPADRRSANSLSRLPLTPDCTDQVPFKEHFSEAIHILHSHNFVVELRELDRLGPEELEDTHLLWLQGGERTMKAAERKVLFDFVLSGGSLLADVFHPPASYQLPEEQQSETAQQYIQRLRNNSYAMLALWNLTRRVDS